MHPAIDNRTPFAVEVLHTRDEELRPVVVPLVRATFAVGANGVPRLVDEQPPVELGGVPTGEPGASSWRLEPETAFVKVATDVVLLGHARPAVPGASQVTVRVEVGPVQQVALVSGDRWFEPTFTGVRRTAPQPFEAIPLTWERAFGGWDRTHPDPARHAVELRNPVGRGFGQRGADVREPVPLPNLEDPRDPLVSFGDRVRPVGFGFTSVQWAPRPSLAGTYDQAWLDGRAPRLPRDFDRRFFSGAAPGLVAPGHLAGGEPVLVEGTGPAPWSFRLPRVAPPGVTLALRGGRDAAVGTALDTVVLDADARTVALTWRGHAPLRDGPPDVGAIVVTAPGLAARAPASP